MESLRSDCADSNLLNKDGKKKGYSSLKYWNHQVFRRDYLLQQEGHYKGAPLRTKAGGKWLNGYSDHLPVVLYLAKRSRNDRVSSF